MLVSISGLYHFKNRQFVVYIDTSSSNKINDKNNYKSLRATDTFNEVTNGKLAWCSKELIMRFASLIELLEQR